MRASARRPKTFRPQLEALEARLCPAFNIHYTSTVLLISGHPTLPFVAPGDGLQVTRLASGLVQVREVGNAGTQVVNLGAYQPPQTIDLNLDFTNADVTVDLGGGRIVSNLLINLGTGDFAPPVFFGNFVTIENGELGGNLTVLNGSGAEQIELGGNPITGLEPLIIDGSVQATLSPNHSIANSAPAFAGDVLFLHDGSTVRGNVTANFVDNVDIGGDNPAAVSTALVVGYLYDSDYNTKYTTVMDVFGQVDGYVYFQGSTTIQQNRPNQLELHAGGLLLNNLTVNIGTQLGVLKIDGPTGLVPAGTVQGSVTYNGAFTSNFVGLEGPIFGSLVMNLQSGNNTIQFESSVAGNMTINAGDGSNDLTDFTGTVAGNLVISLGNGSDVAVIANAPGGFFKWTSGNGNDSLTLGSGATLGPETWSVCVRFGNGDDTFTLSAAAPDFQNLTGLVDGGGRILGNSFVQNSPPWVLLPTFQLINFP